jgi:hypothetical protein
MLEAVPLIVVTFVLVSAFVSIVATAQLEDVRKNWEKRRCEPIVMMMAQTVPTDPNINTSDFASENFQFCIGRLIDSSLSTFFAPIMKIFDQQINLTNNLKGVTNNMNSAAGSLMKPVGDIFDSIYKKFTAVLFQIIRIFYKIQYAIDRVFGIATASVFAGISMYKGIQNTINFVIRAILIILGILVIMVILLFFILFPYVPVILTTITIIAATVAGASAGSMAGAFCVAPGTKIKMEDGSTKLVEELQPGEKISEGTVEGILKTTGNGAKCVVLKGITISACHLVFYDKEKVWIPAGEHPQAIPTHISPEFLYCLNTSSRTWKAIGTEEILLRDWEELPDSDSTDMRWEELIFELLNRQAIVSSQSWTAPGRGLLGPDTIVYIKDKGIVLLKDIQIGDYIKDNNHTEPSYTKVIGTYIDSSEKVPNCGPNKSAWVWLEGKRVWRHPLETFPATCSTGYQLITESGTFLAAGILVRDFTEVGSSRIHETYSHTLNTLNSPVEDRNV